MITIYKDIFSQFDPHYITVGQALERIKTGASKQLIGRIRETLDKEKADAIKKQLPAVCFSGKFGKTRTDKDLLVHSGFLVLDFDNIGKEELRDKQEDLINWEYTFACWISPRGNGLKVLVSIADGTRHREHYEAIKEDWPDLDDSGINESRVCYESYDPEIYINEQAKFFTKIKKVDQVQEQEIIREDREIFKRLVTWLTNRKSAFVTGERNTFIFKLAAACCRFGLGEQSATAMILQEFPTSNDFTLKECENTIRSAYRKNKSASGNATFVNDVLVEKVSREEIEIEATGFDLSARPKDVIYGEDVREQAIELYRRGYEQVSGIGIEEIDEYYKLKRGEPTLIGGIGNYGKSYMLKYILVMRVLLYGEKFALFSPEENPAEEFYHDFVEIMLGCDCTPKNKNRPSLEEYQNAYDFISRHVFYVYPKDTKPTPEYVKEVFLELIIKEKVDGVIIDPFNQLANDYGKAGGRDDKYLEWALSDLHRFALSNNVYLIIVAHPAKMQKDASGNYPCPDVFDMAGGAMWNNKMSNILMYHRPFRQTDPQNPICEFHSKKIKKQKTVGKVGCSTFNLNPGTRRYVFGSAGIDPLRELMKRRNLNFKMQQSSLL